MTASSALSKFGPRTTISKETSSATEACRRQPALRSYPLLREVHLATTCVPAGDCNLISTRHLPSRNGFRPHIIIPSYTRKTPACVPSTQRVPCLSAQDPALGY